MKVETQVDEHDPHIAFSHVHLYVDRVEDLAVYKDFENRLMDHGQRAALGESSRNAFVSNGRDVVKQLLAGFGFRVTASSSNEDNLTRSVLVTSPDPRGVQFVVTSLNQQGVNSTDDHDNDVDENTAFPHFAASNLRRFFRAHVGRQGVAVLAFEVDNLDVIHQRYQKIHPKLILRRADFENVSMLEVFAYYNAGTTKDMDGEKAAAPPQTGKGPDEGTVMRFLERVAIKGAESKSGNLHQNYSCLPGLSAVEASFEEGIQAAYCDHWVSNVFSRTDFLSTLNDTLGFTPKVDFNAGVVAAGEAQIESTVTGNETDMISRSKVLKDQNQVYLPINNALSPVGHVSGFLKEIGQGVQHIASRVENLVEFVQKANDRRREVGEGFTFLKIPRSYYGILMQPQLEEVASEGCAKVVMGACEEAGIIDDDGAVDLELTNAEIEERLSLTMEKRGESNREYHEKKDAIVEVVRESRYINLSRLLKSNLSEQSYLGIVRNQILVDVQGQDLLYQIFTSNMLQRVAGDEAPFLEFIQRECGGDTCLPDKVPPGCGGFGIRNFLTLFLSIEVGKALAEFSTAKANGEERQSEFAQLAIDCFTSQLDESNPILTQISDAMTEEGRCHQELKNASIPQDQRAYWEEKLKKAGEKKADGNHKLMECSAKYSNRMKKLSEQRAQVLRTAS